MSKFKIGDNVVIVSGCMKDNAGVITNIDDIIETDLTWYKVKIEKFEEPIYYLECELERIN